MDVGRVVVLVVGRRLMVVALTIGLWLSNDVLLVG